jgi:hypothetical protein
MRSINQVPTGTGSPQYHSVLHTGHISRNLFDLHSCRLVAFPADKKEYVTVVHCTVGYTCQKLGKAEMEN